MLVDVKIIIGMCVVVLLITAIYAGLFLVLKKKYNMNWKAFLAGSITFFVMAVVLERIMHSLVLATPLGNVIQSNIWLYGLYGALAAAVFEEVGRFVTMKYILNKYHGDKSLGIMFGAGHGGFEAFFLMASGMGSNIQIALMINSGEVNKLFAGLDSNSAALLNAQIATVGSITGGVLILGVIERIAAITGHIAMSMFMWKGVSEKKAGCVFAAFLIHFLFDLMAVLLNNYFGALVTECAIIIFAVISILFARKIYKHED